MRYLLNTQVWGFLFLLCLPAGQSLTKATEPPKKLPLLLQLEEKALVPFYLDQKQTGLSGIALDQAIAKQARRITTEQVALAKQLAAACASCPAGWRQPATGQSACAVCAAGTYVESDGSDEASDCWKF